MWVVVGLERHAAGPYRDVVLSQMSAKDTFCRESTLLLSEDPRVLHRTYRDTSRVSTQPSPNFPGPFHSAKGREEVPREHAESGMGVLAGRPT